MKVSVVIPTLNADRWIRQQLDILLAQTVSAEILVIDSGSKDDTLSLVREYGERITLLEISQQDFDHGGTRDHALRQCNGEYVLFLTQDALPTDEQYIEKLLKGFSAPDIAAVFGRQIAREDAPAYEKLTRQFNYPEIPRITREADIQAYGVKAYFFSDCCSAYRRDIYEAVGGFDAPIITNEDMMMAAKLLHAGYALAYVPQASVYHSHSYTLMGEMRRNYLIGKVMEQYRERLYGAHADSEGWRLLRFVSTELISDHHYGQLLSFYIHACARLAGNRIGKLAGRRDRT